jgi:hypothetical protein
MSIRDQGFGLNYNQGFGSGKFFGGAPTAQIGAQRQAGAADALNQRRRDQAQFGYNRALQGDQLGQRERESQRDYDARLQGYANQTGIANINAAASRYPHDLKQGRWNQVWPFAKDLIGNASGQGTSGYAGSGPVGAVTDISDAPVYSEQRIREQVNAQRAGNDAQAAARNQKLSRELAGRGYGSRSPLAMALSQANLNQAMGANTQAETGLRFEAARANSEQVLEAQKAREAQRSNLNQEDIARGQQQRTFLTNLLNGIWGAI